jgi:hypothetical protein
MNLYLIVWSDANGENQDAFVAADTPSQAADIYWRDNGHGEPREYVRVFKVPAQYEYCGQPTPFMVAWEDLQQTRV